MMLMENPARRVAVRALALALVFAVAVVAMASLPAGQAEAASTTQTTVKVGAKSYTMKLASNQLVMFHGSNTWEYTKLGKITGKTEAELKQLLGGEGVAVTVAWRESVAALQAAGALTSWWK